MKTLKGDGPILIAEDNPTEAALLKAVLERISIPVHFHFVADGQEVIEYLTGEGTYKDRTKFLFPSILFLDLKMPRMDGLQVLRWIKTHPGCKVIPTIMFSASGLDQDVRDSYELGANSYLMKPVSFEELGRMMQRTIDYWSTCVLPDLPHNLVA